MNQTIGLNLEQFGILKGYNRNVSRWRDQENEPLWSGQVRNIRIDNIKPESGALLVLNHNMSFGRYDMWHSTVREGKLIKATRTKVFHLECDMLLDERGNLHSDDKCAFTSAEHRFYFLHGVYVDDPTWVTTPAEELDAGAILRVVNADLRAQLIRKKGIEQVLHGLFSRVLDTHGDYTLMQVVLGDRVDVFGTYLKMKNPSIGVWHMEGVPNNIRTVRDALLWRNNGWFDHAEAIT